MKSFQIRSMISLFWRWTRPSFTPTQYLQFVYQWGIIAKPINMPGRKWAWWAGEILNSVKIENLIFLYISIANYVFLNFISFLNLLTEKTRSTSLQQVKGTIVTNAECMDDYGILNITTKMFCVSSPVQSACQVTKVVNAKLIKQSMHLDDINNMYFVTRNSDRVTVAVRWQCSRRRVVGPSSESIALHLVIFQKTREM